MKKLKGERWFLVYSEKAMMTYSSNATKKYCHLTQGREECGVCKKVKNYVWRIIFGGTFQLCFKSWKMQLHASLAHISLDSRWQMGKTQDLFSSGWVVRSFTITAQSSLTKGWFKAPIYQGFSATIPSLAACGPIHLPPRDLQVILP